MSLKPQAVKKKKKNPYHKNMFDAKYYEVSEDIKLQLYT